MSGELLDLLSLYKSNPKKFDKLVKKATNKKADSFTVIGSAIDVISKYRQDLKTGALRYTRTEYELFSVIKLGKHLVGKEIFRIWNGGKNGKICSKVTVEGIVIKEDEVYVETKAKYSSAFIDPIIRKIKLSEMNITWFLTEEACKKAIERL